MNLFFKKNVFLIPSFLNNPLRLYMVILLLGFLPLVNCGGTLIGAGATAGIVASQERSVGDAVDDLTVRTILNEAFFKEDVELLSKVSFSVIEGRVLLKGTVIKPEDRIRAIKLAWSVNGVREIINEIQVTDEGGIINYAKDTWISTQLKSAILFDKDIDAINYNIETINGSVYIMGIAQSQKELDIVISHAKTISNVKNVVSHVVLKNDPRRVKTP
ncbi:MAG: BON domain-containing protein [Rhodospirillaceae bacterium]|nr:BON domain-containing protein [Alphaproteobacteria bacterium]MBR71971.1 BON domain-containing protein [Rhodospirillaceae bacterium]|tara:strand:- start:8197 stop:8847 length:651 start_codon:yes stop_codon:yes gene_type:complete